jgi:hypothetical protein
MIEYRLFNPTNLYSKVSMSNLKNVRTITYAIGYPVKKNMRMSVGR